MTLDGETIAVVSVGPNDVRPFGRREIANARAVQCWGGFPFQGGFDSLALPPA